MPYLTVPNTVHAAMIDPRYQSVLYIVVSGPRCCGCASSMISNGADTCVKLALMPLVMRLYDAIIAERNCLIPKADHESASDEHVRVCRRYDWSVISGRSLDWHLDKSYLGGWCQ